MILSGSKLVFATVYIQVNVAFRSIAASSSFGHATFCFGLLPSAPPFVPPPELHALVIIRDVATAATVSFFRIWGSSEPERGDGKGVGSPSGESSAGRPEKGRGPVARRIAAFGGAGPVHLRGVSRGATG